jgi:hypothetical protein
MKNISRLQMLGIMAAVSLCGGSVLAQDNAGGAPGVVVVRPQTGQSTDNGQGGPGGFGGNFRGGGNFDPAQMQQMMLDNTRSSLNITNDEEWKAIQPLVQDVMDTRREVGFGGGGMRMMFGGPGGAGGGQGATQSGNAQRAMRFGPQASAEQQALQKTLDDGAPAAQVKEAMAKLRAAKQEKQAKLEAAQEKLRSVLTTKQEAQALLMGLLP